MVKIAYNVMTLVLVHSLPGCPLIGYISIWKNKDSINPTNIKLGGNIAWLYTFLAIISIFSRNLLNPYFSRKTSHWMLGAELGAGVLF